MKRFFILTVLALTAVTAQAKVELPSVFGNNMVLQRNADVAVWGKAKAGARVSIIPSWSGEKTVVTAGKDGKWSAKIRTGEAGGPYELKVSDGEEVVLSDVLLGEVWFCSGQSNMDMTMQGNPGQPIEGSTEVILSATPSTPIRIFKVGRVTAKEAGDNVKGEWKKNTPTVVSWTSAVAYWFAKTLQTSLDVPVGIITTSWGGSTIEAWMSREEISSGFKEFDLGFLDNDEKVAKPHMNPCMLYNGMVAGLIPFTFKGMLWYQGEANRNRPEQYTRLQTEYVKMMRKYFNNPSAPFYFVQIAPYKYGNAKSFSCGYFWEAQEKTLDLIPHSGMATTLDIGSLNVIHPAKKKEVALRLAYLALVNDYGVKGVEVRAPRMDSWKVEDGNAVIKFKNIGRGIGPIGYKIEGFEVAGEDKVFHPATGKVLKGAKEVAVSSPDVKDIKAVRYCFRNWSTATLFSNSGIPACPFRTDNWDDVKE